MAQYTKAAAPRQDLAVLQPPRIPLLPALAEQYNIDEFKWRTLLDTVFPSARSVGAVQMALDYCRARNLDVMKKPVHIVPIWSTARKAMIETVWPGISEHRTTAMRTGSYAGMDAVEFGPKIKRTFKGKKPKGDGPDAEWETLETEVEFHEWCRVTVYRFVHGSRVPFPGPRVEWLETYQRAGRFSELPNEMWAKRSTGQLEKCAEAAALRRAFPEELGDEWTAEEAGQIERAYNMQDVTHEGHATTAPATDPKRGDFEPKESPAPTPPSEPAGDGQPAETAGEEGSAPAGQPEGEAQVTFPDTFKNLGEWYQFSDTFLESTVTTPEMARAWKAKYDQKIKGLLEHEKEERRVEINDTLKLYFAKVGEEPPK